MPQSSSEQSLVTNFHPVLMGNSDILVKDEFGQTNPLEVGDYTSRNGELVNLENACVNIDNSSDVIIGPVTQFNVNGNVTIYQNENGQQRTIDEEGTEEDTSVPNYDAKLPRTEKSGEQDYIEVNKRKILIKAFLWLLLAVFLLLIGTIIVIFVLTKPEEAYIPPTHAQNNFIGSHQFFTRIDWGARPPKSYLNITEPVDMVIIKHTAGRNCDNFRDCSRIVADLQSFSATNNYSDIYCNFLIGGDGNIFEGRGWGVQPQERNNTVDVVFMGSYDIDEVTPGMIDAALALIEDGVKKNHITENYSVVCHNQTKNTMSPGQNVIREVRKWPHYDPNLYFSKKLS